jgi:hypothetical protein
MDYLIYSHLHIGQIFMENEKRQEVIQQSVLNIKEDIEID